MNAKQRLAAIRDGGTECPPCGLSYNPVAYTALDESLPWNLKITADHAHGRKTVKGKKVDEEADNIWTPCGEDHDLMDNYSIEAAIKSFKKRIAALSKTDPSSPRIDRMRETVRKLESGMTWHDIADEYIQKRGPLSAEYERLKEEEYEKESERRSNKKKAASTKRKKETEKAGGSKLKRDYAAAKKPKAGKVPSKIAEQNERPVLNALPNSRL